MDPFAAKIHRNYELPSSNLTRTMFIGTRNSRTAQERVLMPSV